MSADSNQELTRPAEGPTSPVAISNSRSSPIFPSLSFSYRSRNSCPRRPLAVLSLDGAPWESLGPFSQITILENIVSSYEFDSDQKAEVCDLFDMIIGAGTGGVVACMFAVLRMTIKSAKHAYVKFYLSAFRPESRTKEERTEDLKHALETLLDEGGPGGRDVRNQLSSVKLRDIGQLSPNCKFAVTAMAAANTAFPVVLRAYRGRTASIDCTLLEALLATLSDVQSFLPIDIENEKFISANFGHLNPSEVLLKEVKSFFNSDSISSIVSIGPGRPPPISMNTLGGFQKAVHDHAEDCQAASDRLECMFANHPDVFSRFEVDTLDGLEKPNLESTSFEWGAIVSHSRTYLGRSGIEERLLRLSHTLLTRPSRLQVSHICGLSPGVVERIENRVEKTNSTVDDIHDSTILRTLEVQWSTTYRSADIVRLHPRMCAENTRSSVLQRIESWARDSNCSAHCTLFWLTSRPGTGKSTTLRTVCERLDSETFGKYPILANSYFCSIQLKSKDPKHMFPAIALRLSFHFPQFRRHLVSQLQTRRDCAFAQLHEQFEELLCRPWSAAKVENIFLSPHVVVIDALDECENGDEVLWLLMDAVVKGRLHGLKFLISSRPMPSLVESFCGLEHTSLLELDEVPEDEVSHDIGCFLTETLHPKLKPSQISELTMLSCGLFIFASTLVKYLVPSPNASDSGIEKRYSGLFASPKETSLIQLYELILHNAFAPESPEFEQRLLVLHAILSVEEAVPASVIADLFEIDIREIILVAKGLRPVLSVSRPDDPIYVVHQSFYDFVISITRGPFEYSSSFHRGLTHSCFERMKALKFNICNIQSSFIVDDDFEKPVLESIGKSLAYGCQYWWDHFKKCSEDVRRDMAGLVATFLEKKGLFWTETMILLGNERLCRDIFNEVASCMPEDYLSTRHLALEASELVSQFITIHPKITSHLYVSVLSFWGGKSLECWKLQFKHTPAAFSRCIDMSDCKMVLYTKSSVSSVAFSPDGNTIISSSDNFGPVEDTSVHIWDAQSGQLRMVLNGHGRSVNSVAFSPDGHCIISGSWDKTLRIWEAQSGKQLKVLDGHAGGVESVAFSPDGKLIVSGSTDRTIRIWDPQSDQEMKILEGHRHDVTSATFSPNNNLIASGSRDESVRIWDAQYGEQLKVLKCVGWVLSVAFSSDSCRVVSGSWAGLVYIWDVGTGRNLKKLCGHSAWVTSVSFSPDDTAIVSGSGDNSVRIWDAKSGHQMKKFTSIPNGSQWSVESVAFSPDGNRVVSGSNGKALQVWGVRPTQQLSSLDGHQGVVRSVAFSKDGTLVGSGSEGWSGRIWDAQSGRQLKRLDGNQGVAKSIAFSPDNNFIAAACNNSIRIWDLYSGRLIRTITGMLWTRVDSVSFSSDSTRIFSNVSKSVRIWNAQSGHQLKRLDGHTCAVNSVAVSPDDKLIASGSHDTSIRIWDAESGHQLNVLNGHAGPVISVAFSPSGNDIASGSHDNTIRIWNVKSGQEVMTLPCRVHNLSSVAFSPDGSRLVFGSLRDGVRIWDLSSGLPMERVYQGRVTSAAFSPDGCRIVSSAEKSVWIWDARSSQPLSHVHKPSVAAKSILFDAEIDFFEEYYCNVGSDSKFLLQELSDTPTKNFDILRLHPRSTSLLTRKDGWVVTSERQTGLDVKLFWRPPSLRPFYPSLLLEISELGFNGIDLVGCRFGEKWSSIYCGNIDRGDDAPNGTGRIVDVKERRLWPEERVNPQENAGMARFRNSLKEVFRW